MNKSKLANIGLQQSGAVGAGINNQKSYRIPPELDTGERPMRRWLIIGSCLASGLADYVSNLEGGIEGDYIIFNNIANIPNNPPVPITDYDLMLVQIPIRTIVGDMAHARLSFNDLSAFEELLDNSKTMLRMFLVSAMKYNIENGILTAVANFIIPQQSSLGRLMPYNDLRNFAFFVEKLNEYLQNLVVDYQNAFILDVNSIVKTFGSKYYQDEILWQYNHGAALGDNDYEQDQARLHPPQPISSTIELRGGDVIEALWEEVRAIYRTANGIGAVKLVIVDIDDTVWRGVAAEQDEPNPASLEGWPLGLAEALLYLKQRGIVLGIVSKNDEARIRDIWDKMWQGRLKLDDFAAAQINWNQKSENVAAILKAVNVLPDSVVFIDDNPVERFNVESAFPGIRTLGGSLYDVRRILLWAPETQSRQISDESARRHSMIKAQVERESARGLLDRSAFLASLEVKFEEIPIRDSRHPRFDRAFELLNKTNQFNTTGQRWAMEEITKAFEQGLEIFAFSVTDRFTDYGLVGMALVRSGVIEQFVMSCRVIGLDVELECISRLKERYSSLRAKYHDTGKNFLCRDLFERAGLAPEGEDWVWSRMGEVMPQAVSTE